MKNNKNKVLAIIPARQNSQRLKDKNVQKLGSKTLIEHSISYALKNGDIIDKIVVSTDSSKIKEIAVSYGVEVLDRPDELATSTASTVAVLRQVLKSLGENFESIILLQPTNPLRPGNLLKDAFELYSNNKCQSLFTVSRTKMKLGKIINQIFIPENYEPGQRSQELTPLYYENGLLYIAKVSQVLSKGLIVPDSYPLIVEHPFAKIDIDIKEDLEYAEYLFGKFKK